MTFFDVLRARIAASFLGLVMVERAALIARPVHFESWRQQLRLKQSALAVNFIMLLKR